jgi:beta-glucuronidase
VDRGATGAYFDQMHQFYPRTALFGPSTEPSRTTTARWNEKGTYEFQTDWMTYQNQVFDQHPFINGAIAWILRDFKVRPGWGRRQPRRRSRPTTKRAWPTRTARRSPCSTCSRASTRTHPAGQTAARGQRRPTPGCNIGQPASR